MPAGSRTDAVSAWSRRVQRADGRCEFLAVAPLPAVRGAQADDGARGAERRSGVALPRTRAATALRAAGMTGLAAQLLTVELPLLTALSTRCGWATP